MSRITLRPNTYFDVQTHQGGSNWVTIENGDGVRGLGKAMDLARATASRDEISSRVVNEKGEEMARFEANGALVENAAAAARRRRYE